MISYSNGFTASNLTITSFLGHSGGGMWPYTLYLPYRLLLRTIRQTHTTVHSKSVSRDPIIGNVILGNVFSYMKVVKKTEDKKGLINAIGLTNHGALIHIFEAAKALDKGFSIIHSYVPVFKYGVEKAIIDCSSFINLYYVVLGDKIKVLELDASCFSSEPIIENMENILALVDGIKPLLSEYEIALSVKISYLHPYEFSQELARRGVDSLTAINSIPYFIVYPTKVSPLAAYGGGAVSGLPAFPFAYKYDEGLRKAVKIPISMGCGIGGEEQIKAFQYIGADSVNFCTMARFRPFESIRLLWKYNRTT